MAEDLAHPLHSLPATGERERAACDCRGSRELSGDDLRQRLLVGRQDDSRIFGAAVMKLDRAVVDGEVKGRIADQILVGLADARSGFAVSDAHHPYRCPAGAKALS